MSTSFTLNHYVWPAGNLSLFKNNEGNVKRITKLTNVRNEIKWSLAIAFRVQSPQCYYAGLVPQDNWKDCPSIKFCYRLVLKKEIDDTIVAEVSGYIDHCSGNDNDNFFLIKPDIITEGNYVVHLWLDIFADQHIPAKTPDPASFGNSALLTHFRSTLPQVIAGSESPYFDLVAKIGDEKKFYVHRLVLAAHSLVFHRMLSGGEWTERTKGEITIEDADAKSFEYLLHFLYAEKLPDDFDTRTKEEVSNLLYLVEKYHIDSLKENIESLLMRKRCKSQDRYHQWVLSEKYRMPQLQQVCELILSTKLSVFNGKSLPPSISELNEKKIALQQEILTTLATF